MIRSNRFRFTLILVIAMGLGLVTWSYLARRHRASQAVADQLLANDVARQITDFEYQERRAGQVVFRVSAQHSQLTREGVNMLQDVTLERLGPGGETVDRVQGRKARYERANQQISFEQDVQVELQEGLRLVAQKVYSDLGQEVIRVDESFSFTQGLLSGRGSALRYDISEKRIAIRRLDHFSFPVPGGEAIGKGSEAEYLIEEGRLRLRGEGQISGPGHQLQGDQIEVLMSPDNLLQRLEASGRAQLSTGAGKTFRGRDIFLTFDPEAGRLRYLEVLGEPERRSLEGAQAVYEERLARGQHRLEAGRIEGRPSLQAEERGLGVVDLVAEQDVVLRSPSMQIDEASAARLEAHFGGGGDLDRLQLQGGVLLVRQRPDWRETVRAGQILLDVSPEGALSAAEARQHVDVELSGGDQRRRLMASDVVYFNYREALLERIVARSGCVLESWAVDERATLRSPQLDAFFQSGVIQRVLASGGAELEMQQETVLHRTRSQQLEAIYQGGILEEIRQAGNFHLWQQPQGTMTELAAHSAVYQPQLQLLTTGGRERAFLKTFRQLNGEATSAESETLAGKVIIDRREQRIVAEEQVESVIQRVGDPLLVTAGRMTVEMDNGWVRYQDKPRLIQGTSTIRGLEVAYHNQRAELVVQGQVQSRWAEEESEERYLVTSDRLLYGRENGRARYQGEVQVEGSDLLVQAPLVEFFFDVDLNRVETIEASGGALIIEQGRRWTGPKAVYYPQEGRVVITR